MAAKSRSPAVAASSQRSAAPEGAGGWLYRLEGGSPGLGGDLTVYLLLPKPLSPSALGRMAGLLSGDARFSLYAAYAERLPFPARGHAVVDREGGRLLAAAVPEDARRRLEEHRARRSLLFGALGREVNVKALVELLREAARLGADVVVRAPFFAVGGELPGMVYTFAEARAERPLDPSGLRRLRELAEALCPVRLFPWPPPQERELLERAGLGALAWMVPELYSEGIFKEPEEAFLTFEVRDLPPLALPRHEEGARGSFSSWMAGMAFSVWVNRLGTGDLAVLERLLRAAEEARRAWWRRLLDGLVGGLERAEREARESLGLPAPPCPLAERVASLLQEGRGDAKVWEEGGKVKVWLMPPEGRLLLRRLADELRPLNLTPEHYLRKVSEKLGRGVELVGEEPPFRWSPEVDAAAERLRRALERAVGSA
jgi:hypothetical protein